MVSNIAYTEEQGNRSSASNAPYDPTTKSSGPASYLGLLNEVLKGRFFVKALQLVGLNSREPYLLDITYRLAMFVAEVYP